MGTRRNRLRNNPSTIQNELKEMIDQHINSPSIVMWVAFNENWGAFNVKEITDWIKNMTQTA